MAGKPDIPRDCDLEHADDLDALIEAALASEPMRAVPAALHRRVEERLRITAMIEQERARFRYSMLSVAAAFVLALGAGGALVAFTNLRGVLYYGVPGMMGTVDYYTTSMTQSWSSYSGAYTLGLSVLLAFGTVLMAILRGGPQRGAH